VLNPVAASEAGWGEDREEMGVQFRRAAPGPAHAEKARLPFQVHPPVRCLAVIRREHLKEVIAYRLACAGDLGEAA
jgi:hypothetical protein